MGKSRIVLAVMLICSLFLSGCGHEQIASDKALSRAQLAIDIAEQYIAGEISAKDAYDNVSDIKDELLYASDYTSEEKQESPQKRADYQLYLYTLFLENDLLDEKYHGTAESFEEVEESIQKLREYINKYK